VFDEMSERKNRVKQSETEREREREREVKRVLVCLRVEL
jgi:hypothetical protein